MSTSASATTQGQPPTTKSDWLVILPDREGALEARMKVRPDHLANVLPAVDAGFWKMGGATLAAPAVDGQPLQITGSVMMAHAASREEVLDALRRDVYTANEVWDWDRVVVYPFKTAFRKE